MSSCATCSVGWSWKDCCDTARSSQETGRCSAPMRVSLSTRWESKRFDAGLEASALRRQALELTHFFRGTAQSRSTDIVLTTSEAALLRW